MRATSAVLISHHGHSAEPALGQHDLIRPVLELALAQTNAQGAYVYRFGDTRENVWLSAWAGLAPRIGAAPRQDSAYPVAWQIENCAPVVLHENAWTDWRFRDLMEFQRHRYEGVVSAPLLDGKQPVGVVNFCRSRRLTLLPRDFSLLLNLSVPLGSLLTGTGARKKLESEVEDIKQRLEDRKLLDRAKGLLQTRYQWTEERAYYHIRRLSRQQRAPKRNIAAQVIAAEGIHAVPGPTPQAE
jgi:two-component system, response regulator PdtaR